jgi:hypothetical protein
LRISFSFSTKFCFSFERKTICFCNIFVEYDCGGLSIKYLSSVGERGGNGSGGRGGGGGNEEEEQLVENEEIEGESENERLLFLAEVDEAILSSFDINAKAFSDSFFLKFPSSSLSFDLDFLRLN